MINTEHLELIPLKPHQLQLWINDISALEKELGCSYQAETMDGTFMDIVKGQAETVRKDPDNYIWHSFWFLVRKSDRVVVGSADFKNVPDQNGETEIGYGLGKQFEHNGYMTEAVKAMCEWALKQGGVKHVTAETDTENLASQTVLRRCGFREFRRDVTIWWRL